MHLVLKKTGPQPRHLGMGACVHPLREAGRVHACSECRRVNLVAEEMISRLMFAIGLKLGRRYVVKVDKRCVQLLSHSLDPWCERCEFSVHTVSVVLLISFPGGKCEQDRHRALGACLVDKPADISSESVNGLLSAVLFDSDHRGVLDQEFVVLSAVAFGAFIAGACPVLINRPVVVMSQLENHIVSRPHAIQHRFPQLVVERARACASQRVVLNSYLRRVEKEMLEISPSPLAVVAISQRSVSHG